jgi:hypothetical protein
MGEFMSEKEMSGPKSEAWRSLQGRNRMPPRLFDRGQPFPGHDDEPVGVLAILAASTWGKHQARRVLAKAVTPPRK